MYKTLSAADASTRDVHIWHSEKQEIKSLQLQVVCLNPFI